MYGKMSWNVITERKIKLKINIIHLDLNFKQKYYLAK